MNNFVKSEYFNDFWSKAGLHHTSGARIELDDAICMFGVHRKKEKEAFSREDLLRFQSLIPHIKRSLHLYNDYLSTEDYTAIAPELFLNANVGFIALDSKFNFIQTNEIAENILLRGDGLVRKGTKLNAIIENENKLLYKILNSYKLTNKDISKNKLIYISRPNNITSYAVNIIPSFEKHDLLQTNDINASYYVFIIDPDISSTHKLDNFSNFYGLTEAEQKVLKFIVNGNTIQQIAEKHKLSKETIRTHMKSCFYKTQTHSQSQLINKALKETYGI
jgi:DNA-binding CsgD family transcriptional regulator